MGNDLNVIAHIIKLIKKDGLGRLFLCSNIKNVNENYSGL
jgi:hypothetical protein